MDISEILNKKIEFEEVRPEIKRLAIEMERRLQMHKGSYHKQTAEDKHFGAILSYLSDFYSNDFMPAQQQTDLLDIAVRVLFLYNNREREE
jgi:hypothetical protein